MIGGVVCFFMLCDSDLQVRSAQPLREASIAYLQGVLSDQYGVLFSDEERSTE